MYENSWSLPKDHVLAQMWFNLRATSGDEDAIINRSEYCRRGNDLGTDCGSVEADPRMGAEVDSAVDGGAVVHRPVGDQ
jgi:hypothetical protein